MMFMMVMVVLPTLPFPTTLVVCLGADRDGEDARQAAVEDRIDTLTRTALETLSAAGVPGMPPGTPMTRSQRRALSVFLRKPVASGYQVYLTGTLRSWARISAILFSKPCCL